MNKLHLNEEALMTEPIPNTKDARATAAYDAWAAYHRKRLGVSDMLGVIKRFLMVEP